MNEDRFPPTEARSAPPTEPIAGATGPEPPAARKFIDRRKALALLAGGGAAALFAATRRSGGTSNVSTGAAGQAAASTSTAKSAVGSSATLTSPGAIPQETAGPYPGDGTNGPNVLTESGVVRSDIRRSFAAGSSAADGVPLTIELTLVDADTGKALPGAAVYLWHCDRLGRYSLYSSGLGNEDYLRGVQVADGQGVLRFTSIFPGAYSGRWPHIHFHVFDAQSKATSGRNARVTSQLALPEAVCRQVYGTSGYETSARNMAQSSLDSDMVFRDGWDLELPTVTGSTSAGYVAKLVVGV
jgi:protocatechuate 3,4-dioxygenase beta subunit